MCVIRGMLIHLFITYIILFTILQFKFDNFFKLVAKLDLSNQILQYIPFKFNNFINTYT